MKYNENLEISFDMYSKVANDHNFFFCDTFSSKHYALMYILFKEKLQIIQNKNDKIKYLNMQLSIYENLKITKIIDVGLTVLARVFLVFKIIDFNTLSLPASLKQLIEFVWLILIV